MPARIKKPEPIKSITSTRTIDATPAARLQFERGAIRTRRNRSSRVMRVITEIDYNGSVMD